MASINNLSCLKFCHQCFQISFIQIRILLTEWRTSSWSNSDAIASSRGTSRPTRKRWRPSPASTFASSASSSAKAATACSATSRNAICVTRPESRSTGRTTFRFSKSTEGRTRFGFGRKLPRFNEEAIFKLSYKRQQITDSKVFAWLAFNARGKFGCLTAHLAIGKSI